MASRVTINGRFLTRPATGVDRFAIELLRQWLPIHGTAHSARVVIPSRTTTLNTHEGWPAAQRFGRLGGHGWEQFELPVLCRDDLLLSLCNTGPMMQHSQLCVLHDVGTIVNASAYSCIFRAWYRCLFTALIRRARTVATVSEFSASEFGRHFGLSARSLEVIYESGEHILSTDSDPTVLERLNLQDQRYVLCVGSRAPHKNFGAIVRAAAMLGDMHVKVIAAGGGNSRVFADFAMSAPNLVFAGYVTDGELRALYENAVCFAFPSLYEGFGLPPLEAMSCGCPVLVSRRAALPEVCGDGALYCEPDDPVDVAEKLRLIVSTESLRSELRERGLVRAKKFSWKAAAERLQQLIACQ